MCAVRKNKFNQGNRNKLYYIDVDRVYIFTPLYI